MLYNNKRKKVEIQERVRYRNQAFGTCCFWTQNVFDFVNTQR